METVLVATFAEHCQSIDQATKAGAVANIPRLLIPKIDGTPSLAQFAQHESMILGIFKLAAAVNPKAFRVAFIKIDTMYMGNFSGSSTFTGRALWAGENAANGHHIIVQAIRKCKAKGRPRGEVMKRLKAAWFGRLDKGAPSRSSPLRRSASSGEPGSGKLPQSQGSGELQAAAPSDDGSDVSEYTAALESLANNMAGRSETKGGVAEEDESGTEAFSSEGGDQVFDESVCSEHDDEDPVAQLDIKTLISQAQQAPRFDHQAHKKAMRMKRPSAANKSANSGAAMKRPASAESEPLRKRPSAHSEDATLSSDLRRPQKNHASSAESVALKGIAISTEDASDDSSLEFIADSHHNACIADRTIDVPMEMREIMEEFGSPNEPLASGDAYVRKLTERGHSYFQLKTSRELGGSAVIMLSADKYGSDALYFLSCCRKLFLEGWGKEALASLKKYALIKIA